MAKIEYWRDEHGKMHTLENVSWTSSYMMVDAATGATTSVTGKSADIAITDDALPPRPDHVCEACGSDMRLPLEQRPYCATCAPVFGNATVLALVAPEPPVQQVWRHVADGSLFLNPRRHHAKAERVWAIFDDMGGPHSISHTLRSEAVRLWREAWLARERERMRVAAYDPRKDPNVLAVFDAADLQGAQQASVTRGGFTLAAPPTAADIAAQVGTAVALLPPPPVEHDLMRALRTAWLQFR